MDPVTTPSHSSLDPANAECPGDATLRLLRDAVS
jgi:hypothetical protein